MASDLLFAGYGAAHKKVARGRFGNGQSFGNDSSSISLRLGLSTGPASAATAITCSRMDTAALQPDKDQSKDIHVSS